MINIKPLLLTALAAGALLPGVSISQPFFPQARADPRAAAHGGANTGAVGGEKIVDLPLAERQHQRLLYASPTRPRASIVMLPGGAGDVGLGRDGDVLHDKNFVVRTRALWVQRGYAVVIPDTIDRVNLRGIRSTPEYAAMVAALVEFARGQSAGPVFLLGTSQGSIAAVNAAAHAAPGSIAGVVLTESVSQMGASGETVFSADPGDVRVPALIVANRDDRCDVAPPADAQRIAAALSRSANVRILSVAGGVQRSDKACGSLSPHGYYGMETEVIGQIDAWMRSIG